MFLYINTEKVYGRAYCFDPVKLFGTGMQFLFPINSPAEIYFFFFFQGAHMIYPTSPMTLTSNLYHHHGNSHERSVQIQRQGQFKP